MKISVIVPVYDVEQYLDKCVASIINQTYKNLEIFLVDDGGKDNCPQMCDEWAKKDPRIIVIHKENGGQGTARNAALDKMTGDYVLFVDSDDFILPDMISDMVSYSKNGTFDVVLSGLILSNGLREKNRIWYDTDKSLDNYELMREYVSTQNIFTGPQCKLFKAHIFNNIRFPKFRANEDAYIMHHLFGSCKNASVLAKSNYSLTIRPDSTEGRSFNKNKMHLLDCAYDLKDFIRQEYPDLSKYSDFKPISDALSLLRKIYTGKLEKQFPGEVSILRSALIKELEELKSLYPENPYEKEAYLFLNNERKFASLQRIRLLKIRIKGFIKKALIRLKKK